MATIELAAPAAPGVELMLTREQVAEHLGVSVSTVKVLAKDGLLKVVKVGRQVRVRARDLQAYIDTLSD